MKELKNKKIESLFLEAYDKFANNILRHIFSRVSDMNLAEDLASETFLKAWDYIRKGNKVDNLKSLLYKIANNLVIDHYRSNKKDASLNEALDYHDPKAKNKMEEIDLQINFNFVRKNIDDLPEKFKTFIIYRFIDELSIEEISKLSGKKPGNIYVIIHRGLKMLREKVGKYEKTQY